jgi:hypothetical protein
MPASSRSGSEDDFVFLRRNRCVAAGRTKHHHRERTQAPRLAGGGSNSEDAGSEGTDIDYVVDPSDGEESRASSTPRPSDDVTQIISSKASEGFTAESEEGTLHVEPHEECHDTFDPSTVSSAEVPADDDVESEDDTLPPIARPIAPVEEVTGDCDEPVPLKEESGGDVADDDASDDGDIMDKDRTATGSTAVGEGFVDDGATVDESVDAHALGEESAETANDESVETVNEKPTDSGATEDESVDVHALGEESAETANDESVETVNEKPTDIVDMFAKTGGEESSQELAVDPSICHGLVHGNACGEELGYAKPFSDVSMLSEMDCAQRDGDEVPLALAKMAPPVSHHPLLSSLNLTRIFFAGCFCFVVLILFRLGGAAPHVIATCGLTPSPRQLIDVFQNGSARRSNGVNGKVVRHRIGTRRSRLHGGLRDRTSIYNRSIISSLNAADKVVGMDKGLMQLSDGPQGFNSTLSCIGCGFGNGPSLAYQLLTVLGSSAQQCQVKLAVGYVLRHNVRARSCVVRYVPRHTDVTLVLRTMFLDTRGDLGRTLPKIYVTQFRNKVAHNVAVVRPPLARPVHAVSVFAHSLFVNRTAFVVSLRHVVRRPASMFWAGLRPTGLPGLQLKSAWLFRRHDRELGDPQTLATSPTTSPTVRSYQVLESGCRSPPLYLFSQVVHVPRRTTPRHMRQLVWCHHPRFRKALAGRLTDLFTPSVPRLSLESSDFSWRPFGKCPKFLVMGQLGSLLSPPLPQAERFAYIAPANASNRMLWFPPLGQEVHLQPNWSLASHSLVSLTRCLGQADLHNYSNGSLSFRPLDQLALVLPRRLAIHSVLSSVQFLSAGLLCPLRPRRLPMSRSPFSLTPCFVDLESAIFSSAQAGARGLGLPRHPQQQRSSLSTFALTLDTASANASGAQLSFKVRDGLGFLQPLRLALPMPSPLLSLTQRYGGIESATLAQFGQLEPQRLALPMPGSQIAIKAANASRGLRFRILDHLGRLQPRRVALSMPSQRLGLRAGLSFRVLNRLQPQRWALPIAESANSSSAAVGILAGGQADRLQRRRLPTPHTPLWLLTQTLNYSSAKLVRIPSRTQGNSMHNSWFARPFERLLLPCPADAQRLGLRAGLSFRVLNRLPPQRLALPIAEPANSSSAGVGIPALGQADRIQRRRLPTPHTPLWLFAQTLNYSSAKFVLAPLRTQGNPMHNSWFARPFERLLLPCSPDARRVMHTQDAYSPSREIPDVERRIVVNGRMEPLVDSNKSQAAVSGASAEERIFDMGNETFVETVSTRVALAILLQRALQEPQLFKRSVSGIELARAKSIIAMLTTGPVADVGPLR